MKIVLIFLIPLFVYASDTSSSKQSNDDTLWSANAIAQSSALSQSYTYESFMQQAIASSPYLEASLLDIEKSKMQGAIALRYQNPELELVKSYPRDSSSGYSTSLSVPIRLWGVEDRKKRYANSLEDLSLAQHKLQKAEYIRELSLMYLQYATQTKLLGLKEEALHLADTIHGSSLERYNQGAIAKEKMLRTQIDYDSAKYEVESLKLERLKNYSELLEVAGLKGDITVDSEYVFTQSDQAKASLINPDTLVLNAQKSQALAEANVYGKAVEWISLSVEYEHDSDQNIARIGVKVPLAIFDKRSEEQRIAVLEAQQNQKRMDYQEIRNSIQLKTLHQEYAMLKEQQIQLTKIIERGSVLLSMHTDGYKIAQNDILALQDVKGNLIASKQNLIDLQSKIQTNIIWQNYLQGRYND